MFINYPNNPTAACAEVDFYNELVEFARSYDIIVCSDNAYSEMAFDGYEPISFLNAEGAKDVGVEFHSCSKTYNMTGWRIASAVWERGSPGGSSAPSRRTWTRAYSARCRKRASRR